MAQKLSVRQIDLIPGILPNGTRAGKLVIDTTNLGELEWILTPRQALRMATELTEYAQAEHLKGKKR
jgi:hypothetical protein